MCKNWMLISILFLIVGCVQPGRIEFVNLVQNHRELVTETNDALIKSIQDEIQQHILSGDTNGVSDLENLIERLRMGSRQSQLIEQYVNITQVDSDLIAEMVRRRWRNQ